MTKKNKTSQNNALPPTRRQKPTHERLNGGGYAGVQPFSSIKRKNIEALKTQPTKVNRNHNGIVIGSKAVIIGSNWLKKINNWLKLAQIKNLYYLIDRFDASWSSIEKKEGSYLNPNICIFLNKLIHFKQKMTEK